jgi:arsenate reductase (thioredoxin)
MRLRLQQLRLRLQLLQEVTNVLFVCVGNQGRSVIAERLFRRVAPGHEARSAGSRPGDRPHEVVLEALREISIDASDHVPRRLDDELIAWADVVVATCDDACPVVPGKRYVSWSLADPYGRPLDEVRQLRNEIDRQVRDLAADVLTAR